MFYLNSKENLWKFYLSWSSLFKSLGTHAAFNASISIVASPPSEILPISVLRFIRSVFQIKLKMRRCFFLTYSSVGKHSIVAVYINLKIANVLNTLVFPNRVNFLFFQDSDSFSISYFHLIFVITFFYALCKFLNISPLCLSLESLVFHNMRFLDVLTICILFSL